MHALTASPLLPRRLGLALMRTHFENGFFVALGMAFVGLTLGLTCGRMVAIMGCTGALIASVVDHPGSLKVKAFLFALALGGGAAVNVATLQSVGTPWAMAATVATVSLTIGLLTAYGRRGISLGVALLLSLVFGMMAHSEGTLLHHVGLFLGGGLMYAGFALAMAALFDGRNRRMMLAEALRAFARYGAAKAALYDPKAKPQAALRRLIEAHSALTEQLQASRDMIFASARSAGHQRLMAAMITLLDCFHTLLSSDADIDILRSSAEDRLMHRLKALIEDIARDAQSLALVLVVPGAEAPFADYAAELAALNDEIALWENRASRASEPLALSAFRSIVHKLERATAYLIRLRGALGAGADAQAILPDIDLSAFVSQETVSPRILTAHFTLSSPVMRYAIRLMLAMCCGYALTLLSPSLAHGGWVLLTTALIMRASYSITKKRRNDRLIGTVLGCIAAAALVRYLPHDLLFVPMFFSVGGAHAFAPVLFSVTSFCASITALLQLFFLTPESGMVFVERIADTMVGAGLAWLFSFLLPSWEWGNVPKLIDAMLKADRDFVRQALRLKRSDQRYRLSRKRMHDSFANLSAAVRRLGDEPRIDRSLLAMLNRLLIANYMLATEIASMRVLFRMRLAELEPATTEAILAQTRSAIDAALAAGEAAHEPGNHLSRRSLDGYLGGANALVSLRRRLIHMERAAERVGARAQRVRQELQK